MPGWRLGGSEVCRLPQQCPQTVSALPTGRCRPDVRTPGRRSAQRHSDNRSFRPVSQAVQTQRCRGKRPVPCFSREDSQAITSHTGLTERLPQRLRITVRSTGMTHSHCDNVRRQMRATMMSGQIADSDGAQEIMGFPAADDHGATSSQWMAAQATRGLGTALHRLTRRLTSRAH